MTRRDMMKRAAASLSALAALSGCAGGAVAKGPEAAYPPIGDFIAVEGVRLHYVVEGEGPPIVLIHGANGNLRDFTFSLVARLKDRFRVVAIDRPGHGYSERPALNGGDPAVQARLMAEGAAMLGADRTMIVGHSYGGAVAAAWALARPEQVAGVGMLAGATYSWDGDGGLLYRLGSGPLSPVVGAIARGYVTGDRAKDFVKGVFEPNPVPAGYVEYIGVPLALRPDTFLWNAEDIDSLNKHLAAQAPRYGELAMPMEIVHGDADTTVGLEIHSRRLASAAQDASLTVLPGVGHMPHHAREDEVVAALDRLSARSFG
ncbi:MAG: alpha/beta hydrolase [Paracoccaceae bacterium]